MSDGYVAFLRAINTGGRRLTNEQQIAPFVSLGFVDVAAYQAAGNIFYRADDDGRARDTDRIERALSNAYGFDTPVFVRTMDELRNVVDRSPFGPDELAATEGRVQVAFLRAAPADDAVQAIAALATADDRVVVDGREWYWLPRAGISSSSLPVAEVGSALGTMTMRTLGTLQRILAKFS